MIGGGWEEKRGVCAKTQLVRASERFLCAVYLCVFMYKIYINMPDGFNSILFITRFFLTLFPAVF